MRGRLPSTGSFVGNGSAVNIELTYRPSYVIIINRTDGDVKVEVIDDGANGRALLSQPEAMSVPANPPFITVRGFNSGTNALLVETGKVYDWVAF